MSSLPEMTPGEAAKAVAKMSRCRRRQVGAVLVVPGVRNVFTGYNHIPGDGPQCGAGGCPRGEKTYGEKPAFTDYSDCPAVHAEMAALQEYFRSGELGMLHWGRMYVTCEPCPDCRVKLDAVGVVDVTVVGS